MANNTHTVKFVTGKVRISYANIYEPKPNPNGKVQYSAALLIPKSDQQNLQRLASAVKEVMDHNQDVFKGRKPESPIHDGDTDGTNAGQEPYAGHYYVNAKAPEQYPPKIMDFNKRVLTADDEVKVYSGCYVQAVLSIFPYNNQQVGVGIGLTAIRKVADGEPLAGAVVSDKDWDDKLLGDDLLGDGSELL
jgi:hypothetical protein